MTSDCPRHEPSVAHPRSCGRAAVRSIVLLFAVAVPLAAAAQPIPVEPPAPPWKDFVKTRGHANEIPAGWVATEAGRFAHDIVLPDAVPKTVPFDFTAARLRALKPGSKSVARQYWDHLCSTEAGSFILKPVDGVDGFFFMRPVGGANEQQNSDRWRLEAPGLQASWGWKYSPEREGIAFVAPPSATYQWVDFPASAGGVLHLFAYQSSDLSLRTQPRSNSDARFGLTWRGIHRARDRYYAISGAEWIAIDRNSGEVLGVLRDFYLTGSVRNRPAGIYWLNAGRCPFKLQLLGGGGETKDAGVWTPMVLRPTTYPGVLKFLDKQRRSKDK
jgi:hypothetical protein